MRQIILLTFNLLNLILFCCAQKDPHWWNGRNTIVHLFEWKWKDIARECEKFLQHKGYAGVQVSPVTEYLALENHPWWERYQPISYKLTTRSGDENDFLDMTTRCNAVGIRIYVDAVINHMAGGEVNQTGTAGNTADPIKRIYPAVPYDSTNFHPVCSIIAEDYANNPDRVRNCQLGRLNDLNQTNGYVRTKIVDFFNHLIELGVAGFRIDAAKHMLPDDLAYIYNSTNYLNERFGFPPSSKPFIYQEVIDLGHEAIKSTNYTEIGIVTEFKYSAEIGRVFRKNDKLTYLQNWGKSWGFIDSEDSIVFVDNYDNQRGHGAGGSNVLTYKNPREYKMAIAFMLAHPYGITRIMSSFAFDNNGAGPPHDNSGNIASPIINPDDTCGGGWICEHRWSQIYNMVGFKNVVNDTDVYNWWSNGDQQIAFCRGNKGFIAFTNGGNLREVLQTCLPAGIYCDVISGNLKNDRCTGKVVYVGHDGRALIELNLDDGVLAIHVQSRQMLNQSLQE